MEYRTPGVYVEEISKLPPAIAQVESAIPVFIGFTEKSAKQVANDLFNIPTRITSALEYEEYFGGAQNETSIQVSVTELEDGSRSVVAQDPSSKSPFLMRYAIQMYFANGGGPCYILSVGHYDSDLVNDDPTDNTDGTPLTRFTNALGIIEEEDEPTLIAVSYTHLTLPTKRIV